MAEQPENAPWKPYFPVGEWLSDYNRSWLRRDAIAAMTVWALLVPEAMAYASLAGMPAQTGLWTAPLALIGYAIFGTSGQLAVGPSSTVAILSIAAVVGVPGASDPATFIALTSWLALMAGALFLVLGFLRAGFIADFMSKPVLDGFIIGLALTVAASQLPKLFGVHADGPNFFEDMWLLAQELHNANVATMVVGAASLVLLFLLGHFFPRLPTSLIVMVASIVVVGASDLPERGVAIIGAIESGAPPFGLPGRVRLDQIVALVPGALAVVIVGFAQSVAVARRYATKHDQHIDASQEMIALGVANAGAGLSGGFAVNGGLSKTAAADLAGQRTQMAGAIVAVLILITALWFTGLFTNLAEATLGAIVIHAVWGLIDFGKVSRYARVRYDDFWAGATALVGVLLLGILAGLAVAVALSFAFLLRRVTRPNTEVLGRVKLKGYSTPVFRGTTRFPHAEQIPGLLIYRFDSDLFFANAPVFEERLLELIDEASGPIEVVLVDASTITDIDATALVMLAGLRDTLAARGIALWVSRLHSGLAEMRERGHPVARFEIARIYPTLASAAADFEAGVR